MQTLPWYQKAVACVFVLSTSLWLSSELNRNSDLVCQFPSSLCSFWSRFMRTHDAVENSIFYKQSSLKNWLCSPGYLLSFRSASLLENSGAYLCSPGRMFPGLFNPNPNPNPQTLWVNSGEHRIPFSKKWSYVPQSHTKRGTWEPLGEQRGT